MKYAIVLKYHQPYAPSYELMNFVRIIEVDETTTISKIMDKIRGLYSELRPESIEITDMVSVEEEEACKS